MYYSPQQKSCNTFIVLSLKSDAELLLRTLFFICRQIFGQSPDANSATYRPRAVSTSRFSGCDVWRISTVSRQTSEPPGERIIRNIAGNLLPFLEYLWKFFFCIIFSSLRTFAINCVFVWTLTYEWHVCLYVWSRKSFLLLSIWFSWINCKESKWKRSNQIYD